ncbi:hypothetical protein GCM10008098_18200 [Rhodanobacter panaciterrae]|uniref:Thioredoxin domain-containing protein n=1 Tax=Rhodanobacter panaciterrae TaxID=490572 RepID=A0ABQ2ZX09_9GAMM|nr:hypothetical protein [Rhodanobacter panaciterrae]GGY24921.1 hypothetical protein GCM10008098_18200 [Rhodanobacter panaciterrae]
MHRLSFATLLIWLSSALVMAPALAGQTPIRSKAELTRYLQHIPLNSSPLDRLSPGGRKRFLDQLDFGQQGLRGLALDDLDSELTHPQIMQLLALFGEEKSAPEGLTSAVQARRQRERALDAAAQGCAVESCPESDMERRYDELILQKSGTSMPDAERFALAGQRYDHLFGNYQTPDRLRSLSYTDLRLLKRAVENAVFYIPSPTHIAQLQMDLTEMQRRDMVEDKDYARLHQALIANRDFDTANALVRSHPGMGVDTVPAFHKPASLPREQPTALTVNARDDTMSRQAFDLSAPLRIVVVASCHFSQDAARAIEADAQLRPIFASDAIWLASQNEYFSSVADWNREFPDQPIHIAWQNSEWSMLDSWAMPTFYVFRHGRLVKKFSGWFDVKTLKHSLREAGVLH